MQSPSTWSNHTGSEEDSSTEDDEGDSEESDLQGAMRRAELAAFAELDSEARRLVL